MNIPDKMEFLGELPEHCQYWSRKLFQVMEDIGVSTEVRDKQVELNRIEEIVRTTLNVNVFV